MVNMGHMFINQIFPQTSAVINYPLSDDTRIYVPAEQCAL